MHLPSIPSRPCLKFKGMSWHKIEDTVPLETRLTLAWPDATASLWAFPNNLQDLVRGYAYIEWCSPVQEPIITDIEKELFHLEPRPKTRCSRPPSFQPILPETILETMDRFFARPGFWESTGCFHRMALFNPKTSEIVTSVEDIARHNCVDRLAGWSLRVPCMLQDTVLFCSSRVTGSLMTKIVRAGISMVVSRSATTVAAIELAERHGVTLLAFSREKRFTIFCDPNKLVRLTLT